MLSKATIYYREKAPEYSRDRANDRASPGKGETTGESSLKEFAIKEEEEDQSNNPPFIGERSTIALLA